VTKKKSAFIDDVLGRVKPVLYCASWFDRLPPEVQAEAIKLRDQFRGGTLGLTGMQLAKALVEALSTRGFQMPRPKRVSEWLLQRDH
jgi:hypothetical protein